LLRQYLNVFHLHLLLLPLPYLQFLYINLINGFFSINLNRYLRNLPFPFGVKLLGFWLSLHLYLSLVISSRFQHLFFNLDRFQSNDVHRFHLIHIHQALGFFYSLYPFLQLNLHLLCHYQKKVILLTQLNVILLPLPNHHVLVIDGLLVEG